MLHSVSWCLVEALRAVEMEISAASWASGSRRTLLFTFVRQVNGLRVRHSHVLTLFKKGEPSMVVQTVGSTSVLSYEFPDTKRSCVQSQ